MSSASYDYLMYSGYVSMAYFWLKMMDISQDKLKTVAAADSAFYSVGQCGQKVVFATFFCLLK